MADLRPLFAADSKTVPALQLTAVPQPSGLVVDEDTWRLLRDGLGAYDMEIRWIAHLDDAGVLRIWRSWTGFQMYQAVLDRQPSGDWTFRDLAVEQHPERYTGALASEPAQFDKVLAVVVNTLRHFRAGHTPYGASADAEPRPPEWP